MSSVATRSADSGVSSAAAPPDRHRFRIADYAVVLKPRVMSLVVFTGLVGMLLAPGAGALEPLTAAIAISCIAVGAGAAGAINMWYDQDIDRAMRRTMNRPIPAGRMRPWEALALGATLACIAVTTMALMVNAVAAALLALTIVYYVLIYTIWLKRRTPQNVVIGGVSGALPPVIGWAAVTGDIGVGALALFAIIFLWTPPHSWALALWRRSDYVAAGVPMMPVVAGDRRTKLMMAAYTGLMLAVSLTPVAVGMSRWPYGISAAILGTIFAERMARLMRDPRGEAARSLFLFSILYLFLIFVFLLADRAFALLA